MRPDESRPWVERWLRKFGYAFRGLAVGVRDQNSFYVHFPVAVTVISLAWLLRVTYLEWSLLVLCVTIVFSAELLNSAIEHLARAITRETHPEIRDALDVASGAVLVASVGAAVVGVVIVGWPLMEWLRWL